MRVCSIVGARPNFIKYFMISRALANKGIEDILIHTGQHYDPKLSQSFFDELRLKSPDYNLEVGFLDNTVQVETIEKRATPIVLEIKPDIIIVYGDTNSSLGGAIVTRKHGIPLAHVEAGVRSFNLNNIEESNRVLIDAISQFLFCPSANAVRNLLREGITENVTISGDVMYDAFLHTKSTQQYKNMNNRVEKYIKRLRTEYDARDIYLLTIHRAENTDDIGTLIHILDLLNTFPSWTKFIFPIHPRTVKAFRRVSKDSIGKKVLMEATKLIKVIHPVGYMKMLSLIDHCGAVFTDSGGLQKEAYWSGVPCVTLRNETEWVEAIDSGWNELYRNFEGFIKKPPDYARDPNIYGDGHAAESIVEVLYKSIKE